MSTKPVPFKKRKLEQEKQVEELAAEKNTSSVIDFDFKKELLEKLQKRGN
jgi:hypothetical protein